MQAMGCFDFHYAQGGFRPNIGSDASVRGELAIQSPGLSNFLAGPTRYIGYTQRKGRNLRSGRVVLLSVHS